MHLEITTDDNRLETDTDETNDKITAHECVRCSPAEAEGELVHFELPGTVGKDVYRITDVDAQEKQTTLENLSDGGEVVISDDMPFPPNWNRFNMPWPGTRITLHWKEHLNGRGEWVRTTPKRTRNRVELYHGRYTGHEKTRCIEQTIVYTPPGVTEHEIKSSTDDGFTVFYAPEDTEITGLDRVLDQIGTEPSTYTTVGHVYINENHDVVWFDIDPEYTSERYETPFTIIEEINEQRTGNESGDAEPASTPLTDALNDLKSNEKPPSDEHTDNVFRELEEAEEFSDKRTDEILRELEEKTEELSDKDVDNIIRELERDVELHDANIDTDDKTH